MILQDREDGTYYATRGMYCVTLNVWVTLEMEIPEGQDIEKWVTDDFKHCRDTWVKDIRGNRFSEDGKVISRAVEVDIEGKVRVNTPDPFNNENIKREVKEWAEDIADHGKMIDWDYEEDEIEEIKDWDD